MSLARRTVGLSPIGDRYIKYFKNSETGDEGAETLAVQEFFRHFLKMDEEEFNDLALEHITLGRKKDTIYVRFSEVNQAKEIFQRSAQARSKSFKLGSFVPPQVFNRYKAAQDKCATIRENES